MERLQKKSTIGFEFGKGSVMPSLREAISFIVNDLKLKDTDVHSVYRDSAENTFFVKFNNEIVMKETTQRLRTTETFTYGDGKKVRVNVTPADGFFRYVRIFNLPPEVSDEEIAKTMARFGTIRQLVREKLPTDLGFDAYNGTRGAHMEVKLEIPPALFIGHFKCRIFYEGLRNRCFICKEEGHVKADCPSRSSVQSRITSITVATTNDTQPMSYASVTKAINQDAPSTSKDHHVKQQSIEPVGESSSVVVGGEMMEISPVSMHQLSSERPKTVSPRTSRSMEMRRNKRTSTVSKETFEKRVKNDVLNGLENLASKRSKSSSIKSREQSNIGI